MRILLFAASLVLATARPLAAQFPTDVAVGSRVRVVLPDSVRQQWGPSVQWLRGDVAALSTDTLYLQLQGAAAPVPIRRATIRRIDRSLGVPSRAESALRGAFMGAFWIALFSVVDQRGERIEEDLAQGAAIGAGIGFVFGAIFPTERWRRVRLR
jgi:hypothetical protein